MLDYLAQTLHNGSPLGEGFPDLDQLFFHFTPGDLPTVETPGELISDLWSKIEEFPVWDELHELLASNGQLGDVLSSIGDTVSGYLDVSAFAAAAGSGPRTIPDTPDDDRISAAMPSPPSAELASFEGSGAIGDALGAVSESIGGLFPQVSPVIGDALQQVGQAIGDILTPIWERLASLLPTEGPLADLISRLGDWFATISDWWSSATDASLQTSESPAPDWLSGLVDPVSSHRESGDWFS